MNKRDFFKILPGIFCFSEVNTQTDKDLKFLSFISEPSNFPTVGYNQYILKDKSNTLILDINFSKNGSATEIIGTLNSICIELVSLDINWDGPRFENGSKSADAIWSCEISYKNKKP